MKLYLVLCLICIVCALSAANWSVKPDGSGNFSSIQSAITASAQGDTILVYPGTYYENINYSGKNITITSLERSTGNPAYRDSTIIDGNYAGSCVRVETNENGAAIYGFTIQHGSGTNYMMYGANLPKGGGIRVRNALNFAIQNCIIKDNTAASGGGINVAIGSVVLINSLIYNNYASQAGGGIIFEGNGRAIFDSNERCSVYENFAGTINDIAAADSRYIMDVYLDMCSVNPPTDYYIYYSKSSPNWPGYFNSINVLQGFRTEVNHDLYLSPTGDDSNDGLSPATPKKTIARAFLTVASDSLNPKTIYLAPGVYSSQEGQMYPLNMKPYVNLIGNLSNPPILLNEDYQETLRSINAPGKSIENLIFEHGDNHPVSVFNLYKSDNTYILNLTINPVQAITFAGLIIANSRCDIDNIRLNGLSSSSNSGISFIGSYGSIRNSSINNCHVTGDESLPAYSIISAELDSTYVMENVSITNCDVLYQENAIIGMIPNENHNPIIKLTNVLVANNTTNGQSPILMDAVTSNPAQLTNCSIINNGGSNLAARIIGNINVTNCIFDNNTTNEINIRNTQQYGFISHMNFRNNLIRGYPGSVYVHPSNEVVFNEYNFDADPGFAGADETDPLSYRLNYDSPCIDAGTQDTTGLCLPEYDVFGAPRIFNGRIDIGCNEWDGTGNQDEVLNPVQPGSELSISPNPFAYHTIIRYNLDKSTAVELEVYNVKGQKIKSVATGLQTKGDKVTYWDGKDEAGKACSSGIYLLKLTLDGKAVSSRKVTLVR